MAPIWAIFGPSQPQERLRGPQDGPRQPQERPRYLQDGVGEVQEGPKTAHQRSKRAQYGFKTAQEAPKTPQVTAAHVFHQLHVVRRGRDFAIRHVLNDTLLLDDMSGIMDVKTWQCPRVLDLDRASEGSIQGSESNLRLLLSDIRCSFLSLLVSSRVEPTISGSEANSEFS